VNLYSKTPSASNWTNSSSGIPRISVQMDWLCSPRHGAGIRA